MIYKFFWEIKVGDVDKSKGWECETLNGNQKMHQVKYVSHKDPTLLQCCEFSYFACIVWIKIQSCYVRR